MGTGIGVGVGVTVGTGVSVGALVGTDVGVGVTVGMGVAVGITVGTGVGVGVGAGSHGHGKSGRTGKLGNLGHPGDINTEFPADREPGSAWLLVASNVANKAIPTTITANIAKIFPFFILHPLDCLLGAIS